MKGRKGRRRKKKPKKEKGDRGEGEKDIVVLGECSFLTKLDCDQIP
jgi:hypothetical protein